MRVERWGGGGRGRRGHWRGGGGEPDGESEPCEPGEEDCILPISCFVSILLSLVQEEERMKSIPNDNFAMLTTMLTRRVPTSD